MCPSSETTTLMHPTHLELVDPDDLDALKAAFLSGSERLGWVYQERDRVWRATSDIQARIAELEDPPEMPRPAWMSDAQRKVARCPRCSGRIPERLVEK